MPQLLSQSDISKLIPLSLNCLIGAITPCEMAEIQTSFQRDVSLIYKVMYFISISSPYVLRNYDDDDFSN